MSAETTRKCLTCLYWQRFYDDLLMGSCEFNVSLPLQHRYRSEREECDCGGYVFGVSRPPSRGKRIPDFIVSVQR